MSDLLFTGSANLPGNNWRFADASMDFKGDGQSDLLLTQATTGLIRLLEMNGVSTTTMQDHVSLATGKCRSEACHAWRVSSGRVLAAIRNRELALLFDPS